MKLPNETQKYSVSLMLCHVYLLPSLEHIKEGRNSQFWAKNNPFEGQKNSAFISEDGERNSASTARIEMHVWRCLLFSIP